MNEIHRNRNSYFFYLTTTIKRTLTDSLQRRRQTDGGYISASIKCINTKFRHTRFHYDGGDRAFDRIICPRGIWFASHRAGTADRKHAVCQCDGAVATCPWTLRPEGSREQGGCQETKKSELFHIMIVLICMRCCCPDIPHPVRKIFSGGKDTVFTGIVQINVSVCVIFV